MHKVFTTFVASAALLIGLMALPAVASAETCFNCSKESTDACAGKQQCRGTRKDCRKKGCKITGTSSCSSAGNVYKCEAPKQSKRTVTASDAPIAETCFLCKSDSDGACKGAKQCRGTRKECRSKGCKIGGTASCSSASNVKICTKPKRQTAPIAETCFLCKSDSDGGCKGAKQCRGTRKECRDKGCKIGGTASCSSAANVKICTAPVAPHVPHTAGFSPASVAACMSR